MADTGDRGRAVLGGHADQALDERNAPDRAAAFWAPRHPSAARRESPRQR